MSLSPITSGNKENISVTSPTSPPWSPTPPINQKYVWEVKQLPTGKFDMVPPPDVREMLTRGGITANLIYRIIHQKRKMRYVGSVTITKSGNCIIKRMRSYNYELNNRSKRARPIVRAIKQSPEKFRVAVVFVLPRESTEEYVHEVEERFINIAKSLSPTKGYNRSRPTQEPLRGDKRGEKKEKNKFSLQPKALLASFNASTKV